MEAQLLSLWFMAKNKTKNRHVFAHILILILWLHFSNFKMFFQQLKGLQL